MTGPGQRGPRHIALVTQGLERGQEKGGVASVARWLREGLSPLGYEIDVHDLATSSTDPYSRRMLRPTTWSRRSLRGPYDAAHRVQLWGANAVEVEVMRYRPRAELLRALASYDLIQVVAGGPALACAALEAGPPLFIQVATRLEWERRAKHAALHLPARAWSIAMTTWATRLEVKALRDAAGVFVENSDMLDYTRSLGQERVCNAPPGVDTDRFRPRQSGWNAEGYLLSVCRLAEPRKRLDRLVHAYRILIDGWHSAPDLVLAGRGQPTAELERLIEQLDLRSRIAVRSDISVDTLPDLYRDASVFVQTSDEEGLGIAVLEAMASGLP